MIILAWTDICEVTDLAVLLDLLGPFSNLIFKNLPRYEKNKFYSLIFDSFNNAFDNLRCLSPAVVSSFQKFLTDMLAKTEDIRDVLTLEPFLQVVAYLPNNTRQELSMSISEAFLNRDDARITDPVVIHLILSLMRNIEGPKVHKIVIRFL